LKHLLKKILFSAFICCFVVVSSLIFANDSAGGISFVDLVHLDDDEGRFLMGASDAELSFHDSITNAGNVLHGALRYTHDSLVSQWIKKQSDSLKVEQSNVNELELLIAEIESEVLLLEQQKQNNTIVFGLLLLLFVAGFLFRKKLSALKITFSSFKNNGPLDTVSVSSKSIINIAPGTVRLLSELLDKFESEQGFLDPNMTLNLLAQQLHTNSTYLSKVVNSTKGVNFSVYLNDLRIAFIIEQLDSNSKLNHYTSKALSEVAGYKTRESFTKAFYKKLGVYPSAYISKREGVDV